MCYTKYFYLLNCLGVDHQCDRWTELQQMTDGQNYGSNSVGLIM